MRRSSPLVVEEVASPPPQATTAHNDLSKDLCLIIKIL